MDVFNEEKLHQEISLFERASVAWETASNRRRMEMESLLLRIPFSKNRNPSNNDRADLALCATEAHAAWSGNSSEPTEGKIRGLMCDLFHLCDREKIDVDETVRMSLAHRDAEK